MERRCPPAYSLPPKSSPFISLRSLLAACNLEARVFAKLGTDPVQGGHQVVHVVGRQSDPRRFEFDVLREQANLETLQKAAHNLLHRWFADSSRTRVVV